MGIYGDPDDEQLLDLVPIATTLRAQAAEVDFLRPNRGRHDSFPSWHDLDPHILACGYCDFDKSQSQNHLASSEPVVSWSVKSRTRVDLVLKYLGVGIISVMRICFGLRIIISTLAISTLAIRNIELHLFLLQSLLRFWTPASGWSLGWSSGWSLWRVLIYRGSALILEI